MRSKYSNYGSYPPQKSYAEYADYGKYKREAEADADLDAVLDAVFAIKEKRQDFKSYGYVYTIGDDVCNSLTLVSTQEILRLW